MESAVDRFSRRVHDEWLPAFCDDPKRGYPLTGFKSGSIKVSEFDAKNFMRALDSGLVVDSGGGRYRCARSKVFEQIFWTGRKSESPRPLTLWIEPVITIGIIARLGLDFGWPLDRLGMQTATWAFDFAVYRNAESDFEYIAGEVKKSRKEVDDLVEHLKGFGRDDGGKLSGPPSKLNNSRKKWLALLEAKAPYFWAVGPGNHTRLFEVGYGLDNTAEFSEISLHGLVYDKPELDSSCGQ